MTTTISERQFEIIESAGRLLTHSGVSGLTIKNLAKEMNFSESALYRHFPSKNAIIITLLEYLAMEMDDRYTRLIKADQGPEEKFTLLFQSQFSFFKKNPHFAVVVFSDGLMEESIDINEAIMKIMKVKMKHLSPIIRSGQKEGVFTKKLTEDQITHIVMGSIRLQIFKWRVSNFEFDLNRTGNTLIKTLLTIIKT